MLQRCTACFTFICDEIAQCYHVLPLSGSWSYRTIDWTVSVVGAFLWPARQLGIGTFKRQLKTYIFAKYWWQNVWSALEIFLSMRYINLHFTYLLTYLLTCHPTQVNLSHLNLSQTGQSSIYLPHRDEGLSLTWMVGYILRWVTFVQAVTHCLRWPNRKLDPEPFDH